MSRSIRLALAFGASLAAGSAWAGQLTAVSFDEDRKTDRLQVRMDFDGTPPDASSFAVEDPARISIDLPGTRVGLNEAQRTVRRGIVDSFIVLETPERARLVLSLSELAPHVLRRDGNSLIADIYPPAGAQRFTAKDDPTKVPRVLGIDFRRSETGAGQVQVKLSTAVANVDVRDEGGRVVADFRNAVLDTEAQRLDVLDFATPVNTVDISAKGDGTRVSVRPVTGAVFERIAYQVGDLFTIELAPVSPEEIARRAREKPEYTGDRINFSFQNIDLRALLQIIADVAGKNLVVSDSVVGELTLRLENVPWDQALDIVTKTKGLSKSIDGDVIWIAPTKEVAENEKQELEALQQRQELAPLITEVIQINYASAIELAELLKADESDEGSFLSERGKVSVDERTSVLIVQDTRERLEDIRQLVRQLDIPVRQVLIEARIVVANDDFSKSLGVRAGITGAQVSGDNLIATSGTVFDTAQITTGVYENSGLLGNGQVPVIPDLTVDDPTRLNYDFGASIAGGIGPAGLALAVLGKDYLLDLELSAIQAEGRGEVVSSPRVMTANGKEAYIEQGEEIPYTSVTATRITTLFKQAVLGLRVTPQITPDGRVILRLQISKDNAGRLVTQQGGASIPAIETRRIDTEVLINNGETVVLGGVFEQSDSDTVNKIPLLGDIPFLGALFRQKNKERTSRELLIFVTPKIVNESIVVR